MSTPAERYRRHLARGQMRADPQQQHVVQHMQYLYQGLLQHREREQRWGRRLARRLGAARPEPVPGLYIWGAVGRGKTYLMDLFFDCLPFAEKRRLHFHRFMSMVHARLKQIGERRDPLVHLASEFSARVQVLCFDEFHVSDITDAMLLGRLLQALFQREVTLVATSNEPPGKLYWNGLQRERFLPAIEQIEHHTEVLCLAGEDDYRLSFLDRAGVYYTPLNEQAEQALAADFEQLSSHHGEYNGKVEVLGRSIRAIRHHQGVAWFDFKELCDGPRGPADYIELAQLYHSVLLSRLPQFGREDENQAKRFITLVDEFYDRNVRLIVSAAASPPELYQGLRHRDSFRRTASRLEEMGSREYLALPHNI